jgi:hypothetical protein
MMGLVLVPSSTLKTDCNGKKEIDVEVRVEGKACEELRIACMTQHNS